MLIIGIVIGFVIGAAVLFVLKQQAISRLTQKLQRLKKAQEESENHTRQLEAELHQLKASAARPGEQGVSQARLQEIEQAYRQQLQDLEAKCTSEVQEVERYKTQFHAAQAQLNEWQAARSEATPNAQASANEQIQALEQSYQAQIQQLKTQHHSELQQREASAQSTIQTLEDEKEQITQANSQQIQQFETQIQQLNQTLSEKEQALSVALASADAAMSAGSEVAMENQTEQLSELFAQASSQDDGDDTFLTDFTAASEMSESSNDEMEQLDELFDAAASTSETHNSDGEFDAEIDQLSKMLDEE